MNKSSRHRFSSGVNAVLGERELVRLIEDNDYPARLLEAGVVWVELEITDTKTNAVTASGSPNRPSPTSSSIGTSGISATCASSAPRCARSGSPLNHRPHCVRRRYRVSLY